MDNSNKRPKFLTTFMKKYTIASTIFMLMGNIFTYFNIIEFTLIYSIVVMVLIVIFILMCITRLKRYLSELKNYKVKWLLYGR